MNYNDEHEFSSYETDEERYTLNNNGFVRVSGNDEAKKKEVKKVNKKGPGAGYLLIMWIAFVASALGITISIFTSSARSELYKEIESAVIKFEMNVEKVTGDDGEGLIPLRDSELVTALSGTNKEKCIDANGNTVCQIYKVTIKNDSDYGTYFRATLELLASENSNYQNLKWVEIDNGTTPFIYGDIKPMTTTEWKPSYGVGGNTNVSFYLAIWISDSGQAQNDSDYGNFTGNVTFEALSGDTITSTFSDR